MSEDHYIGEFIPECHFEAMEDILNHEHNEYMFYGGRGSGKSSTISLAILLLLRFHEDLNAVCLRKVFGTIAGSLYNQIGWAIERLGLSGEWEAYKQPLEYRNKFTKQYIVFRGMDDVQKIKGIKFSKGYPGVIWFEETAEMTELEIKSVNQSLKRGGDQFWSFMSYNPPISANNWINREVLRSKADRLTCYSSYMDVPTDWIGRNFIYDALDLLETNEKYYRWMYLGEVIGTGGEVFENVLTGPISDLQIKEYDQIYCGIDWGFYPDPFHFTSCYYDAPRRELYIYFEYRCNRKTNSEIAAELEKWKNNHIIADSAENKSIQDLRNAGFVCYPSAKGAGSVKRGIEWLAGLKAIHIDPTRTPHTAREFLEYSYERDKDGNPIQHYPDKDNHAIDAIRYALNRLIMNASGGV
jgi:PBSX family phage terminase large subunit